MTGRLRAVQVTMHVDPERRDPETLLAVRHALAASAAGAARAGVDVCVVQAAHERRTLTRDGVTFEFVDDTRATPLRLAPGVRVPRWPSRLIDLVASLEPHVVHVHGLNYPFAIRQLARALPGVPVMVQDHGSLPPRGARQVARRVVHRWAYRSLAGVAFTAREQAAPFVDASLWRAHLPVFEVLGGSSEFTPGDHAQAQRVMGLFGDPCVLWTGRLDANKDPLTMLAAFELAARELPNARLWCCFAKAPLYDVVQRRIAASPILGERVTLLGARPHDAMEQHFRAADFYIQTSHREASGFSLLEAMACGTTPLVTDIPAARRIVGDVGSLTPVGDAPALTRALVAWAARERTALRLAVRARFERALSYDALGRELRAAYEALVAFHRADRALTSMHQSKHRSMHRQSSRSS